MSQFTDLQFLDLKDVSKEEADEINSILYSTRSSRCVVLPWVEDHLDWNQQSSYEGETSECSEGTDCYQTPGPPVPVAAQLPRSLHQVYHAPVVPAVQPVPYLQPGISSYYQPPPHQVYDGSRRRSKASPKRSNSGTSNIAVASSTVAQQGSQTSGSAVATQYPHVAAFPYPPALVAQHPSPQYTYVGPPQHPATGTPLFLPATFLPHQHMYQQYPHHQVYNHALHSAAAPPTAPQDRSPKSEEPGGVRGPTPPVHTQPPATGLQAQPPPLQPNDIDVGMGGGLSPQVHMVDMQAIQNTQPPPQVLPLHTVPADTRVHPGHHTHTLSRPTSAITPTTTDTDDAADEGQESVSRSARVAPPSNSVQPKPPLNAIKTTSLPLVGAIKANPVKPGGAATAAVSVRNQEDVHPPAQDTVSVVPSPTAPSLPQQPVPANPGTVVTPVPSPAASPTLPPGVVQPQLAAAPQLTATAPTPVPTVPPQSATVPPTAVPSSGGWTKKPWAALFQDSNAAATVASSSTLPPLPSLHGHSPTVAESMLGGNKGSPKTLSKGPPPLNAVVLVPPPTHLVAPGVHHSSHGSASNQHHSDKANNSASAKIPQPGHSVATSQDPILTRIAEVLSEYELEHRAVVLAPRGLNNPSNYCYINATLQALLACAPFYNLIKKLAKIKPHSNTTSSDSVKSPTPVIDSMIQFVNEFSPAPPASRIRRERSEKAQARKDGGGVDPDLNILAGSSFEPTYVYRMLHSASTFLQLEGKQEDAEEFLTVLLNGLNDEMIELLKLKGTGLSNGEVTTNGDSHIDIDNSDWKEVMNKGMSRVTRRTEVGKTPLTDIFMGQLRSRVERSDPQLSTDNIQPFFSLHLDVENCSTLEDALDKMTSEKAVEGGKAGEQTFTASYIENLPVVLILHIKCIYFSHGKLTKISRAPNFPVDLKLEPKLLQPNKSKQFAKSTSYKLFAVVYHEGKEATKGHYLTDVYHVGSSTWIRYDDAQVKAVSDYHVLNPKPPRFPYLLLYRKIEKINRS